MSQSAEQEHHHILNNIYYHEHEHFGIERNTNKIIELLNEIKENQYGIEAASYPFSSPLEAAISMISIAYCLAYLICLFYFK